MLNGFGPGRYIANLGHGYYRNVPVIMQKLLWIP